MSLTAYAHNEMLDKLVNDTNIYVAALTSGSDADEILTGRRLMTFAAADASSVTGSSNTGITISAGLTVTHLALFDALRTGNGNLVGIFSLDSPETFANEGTLSVTDLTITLS